MKKLINTNLITLKLVIFCFLGGIGCLYPYFPAHMRAVELTVTQSCIISVVVPLITIIGPLLSGYLADRLSIGRGCETTNVASGSDVNNAGSKVLRRMLVICFLSAALFYGLLLSVPNVKILEPRRPSVGFMCGVNGGSVYQEMCTEEKMCNQWTGEKIGELQLSDCTYACEKPPAAHPIYLDSSSTTEEPNSSDYDGDQSNPDEVLAESEPSEESNEDNRNRRETQLQPSRLLHLCYGKKSDGSDTICHVVTPDTKLITLSTSLLSATNEFVIENETTWCKHPLGGKFECLLPESALASLNAGKQDDNDTCIPVIDCKVEDPYDSEDSVLAESQCKEYAGNRDTAIGLYVLFRCLGDMFSLSALGLICTACIIATRETSLGRGDVGRQLAFGVIGMTILPPLIGLIQQEVGQDTQPYLVPIIAAIILYIIAALILILDNNMPLTPPEWWWHTKSGMLALPMNTIRRYGSEIVGVMAVLVLLGIFWSSIDTYLAWSVVDLKGNDFLLSLTMTVGSLPAIPILWKAEKVVDYCGHSNIFITAFTFYILRFTGMTLMDDPWWVLLCEVLEVFTLTLVWITAVLYFRHLFPRKHTAFGQAVAVIAHFCLGRSFGAMIGSAAVLSPEHPFVMLQKTYKALAIMACIFGLVYLALYHLVLAPLCRATTTAPPHPLVMQGLSSNGNSNGGYTPLRIYHNERGRKGQFRY